MKNIRMNKINFANTYLVGLKKCIDALSLEQVGDVIDYIQETYLDGKQIFIIGNGGSAATASHMANDLGKTASGSRVDEYTKRFRVMSLVDNVSWITAIGNDLGYDHIFSEQLKNLVQEGDLVIAISGSGNSPNILEGLKVAKAIGAKVIGFLGFNGGKAIDLVDKYVLVESDSYGYIEDIHLILDHLITEYFNKVTLKNNNNLQNL